MFIKDQGIASDRGTVFLSINQSMIAIKSPPQLLRPWDGELFRGPIFICKKLGNRLIALDGKDVYQLQQVLRLIGWRI